MPNIYDYLLDIVEDDISGKHIGKLYAVALHTKLANTTENCTFSYNIDIVCKHNPISLKDYHLVTIKDSFTGEIVAEFEMTVTDGKRYIVALRDHAVILDTKVVIKRINCHRRVDIQVDNHTSLIFKLIVNTMSKTPEHLRRNTWYELMTDLELTAEQHDLIYNLFPETYRSPWELYYNEYEAKLTTTIVKTKTIKAFSKEGAELIANNLENAGLFMGEEDIDNDLSIKQI